MLIIMTMNRSRAENAQKVLKALDLGQVAIEDEGIEDLVNLNVNFEEVRDPTVSEVVEAVIGFNRVMPV
jgi:hypothetical protein